MINNRINVCLACDDNYSKYAGVVIASILANAAEDDELSFYILDGGVSEERKIEIQSLKSIKKCEILFINIDESTFDDFKKVQTHDYLTIAAYYRLKLPSILPDVNRIIYFDCDFVVNTSLKELFNKDLCGCPVAGVHDIKKRLVKKNPTYVNSGMLVMDLDNMRRQNLESQFFEWTKENINNITNGDQEIINEVCKGHIKILEDEWNVQSSNFINRSSYTNSPKCIHFVAKKKPWHFGSFSYHKPYFFKYLQLTPWKLSESEIKHWKLENQIKSIIGYIKYRPLFFFRPKFYIALFCTYISPVLNELFSLEDYDETHSILKIMGVKIKYPKHEFYVKQHENPFYYYKNNNIDITTIPPAEGQIRDIQLANLALLEELDHVCKCNGLKYWLDAGTLIGAIRHKGFIPWDDDIDTAMLRKDYNRIIEAFRLSSRNPDIFADYYRDKKNPAQYMIKVQHRKCKYLFVDIFPFDIYGKTLCIEEQLQKSAEIKEILKKLKEECSFQTPNAVLKNRIDNIMKTQILTNPIPENLQECDLIWGVDFHHRWNNWFTNYNTLFPLKTIEFEGRSFSCMNSPDEFLSRVYGNYMAYPSKIGFGHSAYVKLSDEDKLIIKDLIKGLGR